jgi:hypothetical protein
MPTFRFVARKSLGWWRKSLCLLALLVVFAPEPSMAQAEPRHDFLLLYSNNVHGETEPCG